MHPSLEELNDLVLRIHRAGFQLAIHGVQTQMVDAIICSYEYLQSVAPDFWEQAAPPRTLLRMPAAVMERLKKLQPVVLPILHLLIFSGDRYLATVRKRGYPWLYRTGTLVKNGLTVGGGSDSPIVPNSPIMGIYGAVTD